MKNVVSLVLGGGKGTRLFPLTQYRSKPAVPLAAKYRLIDIPISNCLNSGMNRIYLLTQFNSVSLHRHIRQTYKFDRFSAGFVEILAAQQTIEGADWYQGTADAVRKNLRYIEQYGVDYVAILSGDQLYRMDFQKMLDTHKSSGADVTIAATPVHSHDAHAFGIMRLDETGRVIDFVEKPDTPEKLEQVRVSTDWIDERGLQSRGRDCLASMGIYLFSRDVLVELLKQTTHEDFGKEVFPLSIQTKKVQVELFDGYWEDIGTIRSFYDANLALAGDAPPFEFADEDAPIYSRARFLPPTRISGATVTKSLIADGCIIGEGAKIENSIIGLRCQIGKNSIIKNSVLMGADFYQQQEQKEEDIVEKRPSVAIGENCLIEGAIVDKNCRIGNNVQVQLREEMTEDCEVDNVYVRDGIIVVPRSAILQDGWRL
ncbi:Glucose-1-phosphate adenylyltransferase [hydrothermal vent metagenome]|uniref:Glucose-1-phosphate adenylyltransferase n=1 Tax=hydrothermal vent metagenome TaxID=652676 RepID=A0A3B1DCM6_9ZZZZ